MLEMEEGKKYPEKCTFKIWNNVDVWLRRKILSEITLE